MNIPRRHSTLQDGRYKPCTCPNCGQVDDAKAQLLALARAYRMSYPIDDISDKADKIIAQAEMEA